MILPEHQLDESTYLSLNLELYSTGKNQIGKLLDYPENRSDCSLACKEVAWKRSVKLLTLCEFLRNKQIINILKSLFF